LKNNLPINNWFNTKENNKFIIAGPCSAESLEQLLEVARQLSQTNKVSLFRAGVWKPRTRPDSFEGIGNKALKWLKEVKAQTNLSTITEVASPAHVDACLTNGIDALWIGARTVSNPFSIQEIANSLKGVDIPIFVKNPINPDIQLWIGAIERLANVGVKKIAAIHRGFYPFEKSNLRNIPKWELAIELKTFFPDIPIITDPSHIAGKVSYIKEIAQYAYDLSFDGLMLEVHHDPSNALSDSQQQITPNEFISIINSLLLKNVSINNFENYINNYRAQIDSIDYQMLKLLLNRMEIVKKIGYLKKENNIAVFQLSRWKDILKSRINAAETDGLNKEFIYKLLELIHKESIKIQSDL